MIGQWAIAALAIAIWRGGVGYQLLNEPAQAGTSSAPAADAEHVVLT